MSTMDYAKARELMVEQQIRPWDVLEPRVLDVLSALPREAFVQSAHQTLAYTDVALPRADGGFLLKPVVEGRVLQAVNAQATEDVLLVGSGGGYLAACLGQLAREVVVLEPQADAVAGIRDVLAAQRIGNVRVEHADPMTWGDGRRFNAVCVTGAVDAIPSHFLQWLQPDGRMFVVRGRSPAMEAVLLHNEVNAPRIQSLFETDIPYLPGAAPAPAFDF